MTTEPLVSILIASYNNGKYIPVALNSIINQGYKNWEVVFIDDCSTDNSLEIVKHYTNNSRIKVYSNHENKGCGYTKRRCVELATGELCGFLDPDDSLEPDALKIMVEAHTKEGSCSLIYSTHYLCDQDLNIIQVSRNIGEIPAGRTSLSYKEKKISHFATFKKEYYLKTSGINPLLRRAVDQDLYYKLEEVGDLLYLDLPLYNYRLHKAGISNYSSRSKAVYWNLIVQKETILRRKKSGFKSDFSMSQLVGRYQAFVKLKSQEKLKKREYIKLAYIIFSGIHFLNYNILSLKLLRYFLPSSNKYGTRY